MGGFDPGCKQPRAHLMAGIDNVQSSAPGAACKYGLSLLDFSFDGACKYWELGLARPHLYSQHLLRATPFTSGLWGLDVFFFFFKWETHQVRSAALIGVRDTFNKSTTDGSFKMICRYQNKRLLFFVLLICFK